eukprot:3937880-Prorocentrum_lima.AAC.1
MSRWRSASLSMFYITANLQGPFTSTGQAPPRPCSHMPPAHQNLVPRWPSPVCVPATRKPDSGRSGE